MKKLNRIMYVKIDYDILFMSHQNDGRQEILTQPLVYSDGSYLGMKLWRWWVVLVVTGLSLLFLYEEKNETNNPPQTKPNLNLKLNLRNSVIS